MNNKDFAVALYRFEHLREWLNDSSANNEQYILTEHFGAEIKNFPATYKNTPKRRKQGLVGKKFIDCGFNKENPMDFIGKRYYPFVFGLGLKDDKRSRKKLTGAEQSNADPNIYFGDDRNIGGNDGLVFEFSDNRRFLSVYFFRDRATDFLQGKLENLVLKGALKKSVERLCSVLTEKEKAPKPEA